MKKEGMFEFEVLVHGRPVREYPHEGSVFIEGRQGSEFTLRVRNNSGRRVLAIISVDGLSVMNGQPASRKDGGYVIGPYNSIDVPGWRVDNESVAHFFFGNLPEGYATKMGQPTNIGVIGAVLYLERRPLHSVRLVDCSSGEDSFSFRSLKSPGLATGFGRETEHRVTSVSFDRENTVSAEFVIRYDTAENLRQRGIHIDSAHKKEDAVIAADPFPADRQQPHPGCLPPTGWPKQRQ